MHNLRRIREHGAKDERERILKLIDEMIKKNKMQFHTKKCACVPCQKLALVIYWLEKLKSKIQGK